jgi:tetratricopeptide (TPR) repeat protein
MPFRFFRRLRIAPGLTLNLSKTGVSVSAGPRGAKFTVGTRGNRSTIGLPGTGLFYTVFDPLGKAQAAVAAARPSPGFFQRLTASTEERAFIDALAALDAGRDADALPLFEAAAAVQPQGADAAWMAGMLSLKLDSMERAERHLRQALQHGAALGQWFGRHGLAPRIALPVTPEVTAIAEPGVNATLLALAEIAQLQGRADEALAWLERLLDRAADDPVAIASFAELALDANDDARIRRVVELAAAMGNDTAIHTAVLLYRGLSLVRLGMDHAAEATFTAALRRTKDRPVELLREIRYRRALTYERLGKRAQARREMERIYGEEPGFEDVARRLKALA